MGAAYSVSGCGNMSKEKFALAISEKNSQLLFAHPLWEKYNRPSPNQIIINIHSMLNLEWFYYRRCTYLSLWHYLGDTYDFCFRIHLGRRWWRPLYQAQSCPQPCPLPHPLFSRAQCGCRVSLRGWQRPEPLLLVPRRGARRESSRRASG